MSRNQDTAFIGEQIETEVQQQESKSLMLHTKGLTKRYGKRTVINKVSYNVQQGKIVGLLGSGDAREIIPSYMTTGLMTPNERHVYLNEEEITEYPVYKRAQAGIGYLSQETNMFRKVGVEDNILLVLEMTKLPRQEQLDKLRSLINEFRLNKVRKNKGNRLSGGERRHTEVICCLTIDPKFIILDGLFAGIDPIAVKDIQHIVWRLKYHNIGILITDHNVQETLTVIDRIYSLFEGEIPFYSTLEELANNKIVREKCLGSNFILHKKDLQLIDEERGAREE